MGEHPPSWPQAEKAVVNCRKDVNLCFNEAFSAQRCWPPRDTSCLSSHFFPVRVCVLLTGVIANSTWSSQEEQENCCCACFESRVTQVEKRSSRKNACDKTNCSSFFEHFYPTWFGGKIMFLQYECLSQSISCRQVTQFNSYSCPFSTWCCDWCALTGWRRSSLLTDRGEINHIRALRPF